MPESERAEEARRSLRAACEGDESARSRINTLVYRELHELASNVIGNSPGRDVNLQPTLLVHEAYLKLMDREGVDLDGQTHFFALAAVAMRHVLIDTLRRSGMKKRGGDWNQVTLSGVVSSPANQATSALDLEQALSRLEDFDPRAAKVVTLKFFGGLTEPAIAQVIGVSERTVRNDWRMAQAWLRCELEGQQEDG